MHAASRLLVRLLVAAISSVAIISLAVGGTAVTTAPEWVSLAFEPLSLLLLPGVLAGMIYSRTKDMTPHAVAAGGLVFYFVATFVLLSWRARLRQRRLTQETT